MAKQRKIPQRTCLGCQTVRPKREMLRIVRTPTGEVIVDPTGKKAGRGTYVCPDRACLERALSGDRLTRALETPIGPELLAFLREQLVEKLMG
ncbi:MAG: YlxR family protein [Firmicutes bacterium]|nr:YlxR family protein [Bacillota bacterium]